MAIWRCLVLPRAERGKRNKPVIPSSANRYRVLFPLEHESTILLPFREISRIWEPRYHGQEDRPVRIISFRSIRRPEIVLPRMFVLNWSRITSVSGSSGMGMVQSVFLWPGVKDTGNTLGKWRRCFTFLALILIICSLKTWNLKQETVFVRPFP